MFFDSNCKINPIFEYEFPLLTQKYVNEFNIEDDPFLLNIAIKIMEAFLKEYKSKNELNVILFNRWEIVYWNGGKGINKRRDGRGF